MKQQSCEQLLMALHQKHLSDLARKIRKKKQTLGRLNTQLHSYSAVWESLAAEKGYYEMIAGQLDKNEKTDDLEFFAYGDAVLQVRKLESQISFQTYFLNNLKEEHDLTLGELLRIKKGQLVLPFYHNAA